MSIVTDNVAKRIVITNGASTSVRLAQAAASSAASFAPYASRSNAEAANVPAPAIRITVYQTGRVLSFVEAPDGEGGTVALTTADGRKWVPDGDVLVDHFGENTVPGTTDMSAAIQAALNYAGQAVDPYTPYPQVTAKVKIPAGTYHIASGQTVTLPRGVLLEGESRTSTRITHGGGSVPCFRTDDTEPSNTHVQVAHMEIVGAGATTTYGIEMHLNSRNGLIDNVRVTDCNVNLYAKDSWTLVVQHCDFQDAITNNVECYNITAGLFFENRIDQAGQNNMLITKSATLVSAHVKVIGGHYQRAGRAGIRLVDVDSAQVIAPYFEGNNQDSNSHGDIEWVHGAAARGRTLSVFNSFHTATSGGTNSRIIVADTAGHLEVAGMESYIGTAPGQYAVGIELGSSMVSARISGSVDATTRVTSASPNTKILDLEALSYDLGSAGTFDIESGIANVYVTLDAPGNRRLEMRLANAGTDKWFIGRGDSDESNPDYFYIGRASGGGATPDFKIDHATGYATFDKPMSVKPVTVASLPAPAAAGTGARSYVTDAASATWNAIVAGGGSNKVPVISDGTNWRIG